MFHSHLLQSYIYLDLKFRVGSDKKSYTPYQTTTPYHPLQHETPQTKAQERQDRGAVLPRVLRHLCVRAGVGEAPADRGGGGGVPAAVLE